MKPGRLILGVLFLGAGSAHFLLTPSFVSIVPDYLPAHLTLVRLSGIAEMAGGAGLLVPATRRWAAWGMVGLLVAVFPANLWMAQHPERFRPLLPWQLWARLPLQLPLILWAWAYTRPAQANTSRQGGEAPRELSVSG